MAGGGSIPDANKAMVAGQVASVENFPFEQIINQLAQLGQSRTINGVNYDFTGLGNADQAAVMGAETAQNQLDLQRMYGPAFVQEALRQVQQANPAGTAAEAQLGNMVSAPVPGPSTTAQSLQDQLMAMLKDAGTLTTGPGSETEQVQQAVRGQQLAHGITLGNAPASAEASALEQAGQQQRGAIQNAATRFLQSGVSPEDVQYRQIQQQLSNLGAFWAGQTPLAQFPSLSNAQAGAAPSATNYQQPAGIDLNAALQGMNNANQIYSGQVNWNANQMNPWLAGLTTGAGGLRLLSAGGVFNPSGSTSASSPVTNGFGGLVQPTGGTSGTGE